jgi:hypothetical protein
VLSHSARAFLAIAESFAHKHGGRFAYQPER